MSPSMWNITIGLLLAATKEDVLLQSTGVLKVMLFPVIMSGLASVLRQGE